MSNTPKLKPLNGVRSGPRAAAAANQIIDPVTPEQIKSGVSVAAELGSERAWQQTGWVQDATTALATVHKIPVDTAKAAILRTVALLAFCGTYVDKLRQDGHLWGGVKGTIFSVGLFEAAAKAPCSQAGLNHAAMFTILQDAPRLPPVVQQVD